LLRSEKLPEEGERPCRRTSTTHHRGSHRANLFISQGGAGLSIFARLGFYCGDGVAGVCEVISTPASGRGPVSFRAGGYQPSHRPETPGKRGKDGHPPGPLDQRGLFHHPLIPLFLAACAGRRLVLGLMGRLGISFSRFGPCQRHGRSARRYPARPDEGERRRTVLRHRPKEQWARQGR